MIGKNKRWNERVRELRLAFKRYDRTGYVLNESKNTRENANEMNSRRRRIVNKQFKMKSIVDTGRVRSQSVVQRAKLFWRAARSDIRCWKSTWPIVRRSRVDRNGLIRPYGRGQCDAGFTQSVYSLFPKNSIVENKTSVDARKCENSPMPSCSEKYNFTSTTTTTTTNRLPLHNTPLIRQTRGYNFQSVFPAPISVQTHFFENKINHSLRKIKNKIILIYHRKNELITSRALAFKLMSAGSI